MLGRGFNVTIRRPSASDSIILEVSQGMRMVKNGERGDRRTARKEGRGDGCSMGWGSLGSSTMACDGPGWRFIGDSWNVRTRNQVGARVCEAGSKPFRPLGVLFLPFLFRVGKRAKSAIISRRISLSSCHLLCLLAFLSRCEWGSRGILYRRKSSNRRANAVKN